MSNEKTHNKDAWKTPFNPAVTDDDVAPLLKRTKAKIVSLEIEEGDGGGDPYNHTGSFAVPEFDKD